jgi:hypothetical protein
VLAFVLVVLAAALVVLVLYSPFRRAAADVPDAEDRKTVTDVAALEAAREAKYREIRDAELDHNTGKLSDEDYQSVDNTLRAEAIAILEALDHAREG